jgi:hypothetical protein
MKNNQDDIDDADAMIRGLNLLTRKLTLNILTNVSRAVRRWCNAGGQVVQLCNIRQRLNNANSEAESGMLARVFECDIHRRRCQEENIPVSMPI